jgi:hypothetical protein
MVKLRPYVVGVDHVPGCPRRRCGPECKRKVDGLEADIRFWLPSGEEKRFREKVPVTGKSNARRWAEEREAELVEAARQAKIAAQQKEVPEVKQVPKVSVFNEQFMTFSKTNNRPSTVYAKEWMTRLHIIPFFGEMRLDAIGPAEVEKYKALKLEEGHNKKSINNHLTALRKLLNLANEYRVINQVPKIRGFKVKVDYITDDEFLRFEEAVRLVRAAVPEWRTFIIVALKTGLRAGELLALKWQDLDLVAGQLVVRRTVWKDQEGPPKGGRPRAHFGERDHPDRSIVIAPIGHGDRSAATLGVVVTPWWLPPSAGMVLSGQAGEHYAGCVRRRRPRSSGPRGGRATSSAATGWS